MIRLFLILIQVGTGDLRSEDDMLEAYADEMYYGDDGLDLMLIFWAFVAAFAFTLLFKYIERPRK